MARKNPYYLYNHYQSSLVTKAYTTTCPDCNTSVLPKQYEKHQAAVHRFNPKNGCAWCKQRFWPSRTKALNADHLLQCSKRFVLLNRYRPVPPDPPGPSACSLGDGTLRLVDLTHRYDEKVPFEIEHDLPPYAHDPIHPLDPVPRLDLFSDEHLNLAASYLLFYLRTRETHDWYHVMVKVGALPSFLEAMTQAGESCRTLLFFCWCNGGDDAEAKYRHHRHMVAVCEKGCFHPEVWSKVATSDRPRPNFLFKRKIEIENEMHLINTVLYVSNRRSRCNFSFDKKVERKDHHFFLNKTMPRGSLLPLCLLFEEGWDRYLYQSKFQNASVERVLEHPLVFSNGKWRQRIKHFYDLKRGLVLPVRKGFAPTETAGDLPTFHLADGRKLYFERRPEYEALNFGQWLRAQAAGGNRFYDALEEAWWTPRQRLQNEIGRMKPLLDRNAELETENAQLAPRVEQLETLVGQLTTEKAQLATRVERLTTENAQLVKTLSTRESC